MPAVRSRAEPRETLIREAATAMAWLGGDRGFEAIAVPGVVLDDGEALVEVELATVCGSDLHTVSGRRPAPVPIVLGHECVARVVATGHGGVSTVAGERIGPGDRVVFSVLAHCGDCDRCARGLVQKCRRLVKYGHERIEPHWELGGGFASHVHLRRGTAVVRVAEEPAAAALAPVSCAYATAWAALRRAEATRELAGATLAVMGAGLVGLATAAMALDRGARVVVADPDPGRRALALRFGASAAMHPRDTRLAGAAVGEAGDGADVVVEASGAAVGQAIALTGTGGAVVLVGSVFPGGEASFDPARAVSRLLAVSGVHNYRAEDLAGAADWVTARADRYPLAEAVGAVLPLARVDEAIALAATGAHPRVGLDPCPVPPLPGPPG